jgi:formate dehydrogenase major subunit
MQRMRLGEADETGRRRPVPVPGSEFVVECDMVIPAVGQRPSSALAQGMARLNRLEGIEADPVTGATSADGVFAGGDCVSGGATVIEAIRAGQRAAVAIDRRLGGSGVLPANVGMSLRRPTEEELERILPRAAEPWLALEQRKKSFVEVICGLKPEQACYEAGRCLRCDLERSESLQARRGA